MPWNRRERQDTRTGSPPAVLRAVWDVRESSGTPEWRLRRAYQRIPTEGVAGDVLWFIDLDILLEEWDALHLSPHGREPWERWRGHGHG